MSKRYIDVDQLKCLIYKIGFDYELDDEIAQALANSAKVMQQGIIDIIDNIPEADVVPKTEFDALDAECSRLERYESTWYDEITRARAEVDAWKEIAETYQLMLEEQWERHQKEVWDIFTDLEQRYPDEDYTGGVEITRQELDELKKRYGVV